MRGAIGDFGSGRGLPSAAATDGSQIYLGWSRAGADDDDIVACDPAGALRWDSRRGPLSGCRALAADAGLLYVLGGAGPDADGRAIYRLNAKTGALAPWPDGRIDLRIASLWPASGKYKPDRADYMGVKNGRIYLSFNAGQFLSVLDAKSGAYLQTIVGGPPGPVDAAPTKSDNPDKPDTPMDADFVAIALEGGIGKILLAHDAVWVLASELSVIQGDPRITALSVIGDGAPHFADDIFLALGPPQCQVQARAALNSLPVIYTAGEAGGRIPQGPWQPHRLGEIRGLALDATGKLWIAEGGGIPGRISVWTTDHSEGRLVREFFSPPDPAAPVAIDPCAPGVLIAGGCEWRIDPATGRAACLGIVTRDPFRAARFVPGKHRHLLLVLTPATGADVILERAGPGDYRPLSAQPLPAATPPKFQLLPAPAGQWRLTTATGYDLGALPDPTAPSTIVSPLTQTTDGRLFATISRGRIWAIELTGLDTLRPIAAGKITLPPPGQ